MGIMNRVFSYIAVFLNLLLVLNTYGYAISGEDSTLRPLTVPGIIGVILLVILIFGWCVGCASGCVYSIKARRRRKKENLNLLLKLRSNLKQKNIIFYQVILYFFCIR